MNYNGVYINTNKANKHKTVGLPAIAQQPACKGAVWGHPLHYSGGQQADHQLHSHKGL